MLWDILYWAVGHPVLATLLVVAIITLPRAIAWSRRQNSPEFKAEQRKRLRQLIEDNEAEDRKRARWRSSP